MNARENVILDKNFSDILSVMQKTMKGVHMWTSVNSY